MFSYFFLSQIARTLKYAWAVPVSICYNIKGLVFYREKPFFCRHSNVPIVWLNFPWPVFLILVVLTCLFSPVCAVLSALSCLRCPVCSVLSALSCMCLSCLFHSSLSLGLSVLTVLFKLSFCFISWPFLPYYPSIPVLFFLSSLLCSFSLSCSCLSCLYCPALDILYGLLSIQGFYETGIPSCLPCPSLHSFLSSPVFFGFYHSMQYC